MGKCKLYWHTDWLMNGEMHQTCQCCGRTRTLPQWVYRYFRTWSDPTDNDLEEALAYLIEWSLGW